MEISCKRSLPLRKHFCNMNVLSEGTDLFLNAGACLTCTYCLSGSCSIGRQLEPRYITCTEGADQSTGGKEPGDNARDSKVKVLLVRVV